MPGVRVIWFVADGVFLSVLDSQVVIPLQVIGRVAPQVRRALLVLTSFRLKHRPAVRQREEATRSALPGAMFLHKYRPPLAFPFEARIWARLLEQAINECGYTGPQPIVVHCRGSPTAAAARLLKRRDPRIRVLLDVRGARVDEAPGRGPVRWYYRRAAKRALVRALSSADALNAVSSKMLDYLRQEFALDHKLPCTVLGGCIDTQRFYFDPAVRAARRRELGFDGRFVVCYCGAMAHWQRPDAVAEAFAAIHGDMPDAHMLVVSSEPQPFLEQLGRVGVDARQATVRTAAHDEVAAYLMAADVGLLLREDSLTNRVAAPVKFAEYLRCGLPVILTPYVGDFGELARSAGIGQIVDFPIRPAEVLEAARRVRAQLAAEGDAYRVRCSQLAAERLSWERQIAQLVSLYEALST